MSTDIYGTPLAIGQRVHWVEGQTEGIPSTGQPNMGTLLAWEGNDPLGRPGISWDGLTGGHNLDGTLPPGNQTGWWTYSSVIAVVSTTTPVESLTTEQEVEQFANALKEDKARTLIVMGEQVYAVNLVSTDLLHGTLAERDRHSSDIVRNKLLELDRRKHELEVRYSDRYLLPNISLSDLQEEKVMFCINNGGLAWILPFIYAPVEMVENHTRKRIPDEEKVKLQKSCYIMFFNGYAKLLTDNFEHFVHYHALGNHDCLGSYHLPPINSVHTAVVARNEVEDLFSTINLGSLGANPPWCIDAYRLWDKCQPIPNPTSAWRNPFRITGTAVRVTGHPPNFPEDCIGSIGVIRQIDGNRVQVGFRFSHPSFRINVRARTLCTIPIEFLEIMPPETPLTGRAGIASRNPEEIILEDSTEPHGLTHEQHEYYIRWNTPERPSDNAICNLCGEPWDTHSDYVCPT